VISRPPFAQVYWTPGQHLAHLTANGASLRTGDLLASGTVSGPERGQRGSLIELAWNGTDPLPLPDGTSRSWLADGDTVTISAWAPGAGGPRIGWGDLNGTIHPALPTMRP
jgi:fumarylacetoacetase